MPKGYFKRRRPNRGGGNRKPKSKITFAKRVLSVFDKKRELKVVVNSIPVNSPVLPGINAGTLIELFPPLAQGVNEYERIGNQITLKKLVVRGYYRMSTATIATNDTRCLVRHMVLKQRNSNSADSVRNTAGVFLQNAVLEQATSYLGNIESFTTPINKAAFITRKDIRKVMVRNLNGSTDSLGQDTYFMYKYTLTFGKGKVLHFRNSGADAPADFPYFLAHSASAMGTNTALNPLTVDMNMTTTAYFYDN